VKLPYTEGTVFLVPLTTGGHARGVVARVGPKGRVLFGYFFGPCLASADTAMIDDIDPAKAILQIRFGDLGLINGEWPIRGTLPVWDRSKWPMPDFARRQLIGKRKPVLVRYSDADPTRVEAEYRIDDDAGMPIDSLAGYGAVETRLTNILSPPPANALNNGPCKA
jgi:hypothetical protein